MRYSCEYKKRVEMYRQGKWDRMLLFFIPPAQEGLIDSFSDKSYNELSKIG